MTHSTDFKYRAFISYSHADTPVARWLHLGLQNFSLGGLAGRETARGPVPKDLRPIFRDREDTTPGTPLDYRSIAALDASAALIVLCSPESARSHYVNEEIRLFRHRHPDRPIVPVRVSDNPGDAEQGCFAPALRFEVDAEGHITDRSAPAPIAADVQKDGRELALAKVVAALIGVPSDEVYRGAESERKQKARIRNAIVALVLILVGAGGFLSWRTGHRDHDVTDIAALVDQYAPLGSAQATQPGGRERLRGALEAIARGATANPRYRQALDLINAGKPREAEPLLRAAAEDEEQAGPDRIRQAAEKWRNLGAIAGYSDPKRARDFYAKAVKLDPDDLGGMLWHGAAELAAGNLSEAERACNTVLAKGVKGQDDIALYLAKMILGDILVARADLPRALQVYRETASEADRLSKAEPSGTKWQLYGAAASYRVGNVLEAQGALAEALAAYRDSLATFERLSKADPANLGLHGALSEVLTKVGDVQKKQGNLPDAQKSYRDSLIIAEDTAKADPSDALSKHNLSVALNREGDARVARGALPDALKTYRESLAIAQSLVAAEPANLQWQRDLFVALNKAGDLLAAQGGQGEALKAYRDGLAIAQRLAKGDAANADWQRDLSMSYNKVGDTLVARGALGDALKAYRDGLAIAEHQAKADPASAQSKRDLSASYNKIGDVLAAKGASAEALRAYRDGLMIAERLASSDPGNAQSQRDLAISYERIGGVLMAQGAHADAFETYRDGLAIAERLAKAEPNNIQWQRDLASGNERLGEMLARAGKTDEAIAAYESALANYDTLINRLGDPQARLNSVVTLWGLGNAKGKNGQQDLRRALAILVEINDANKLDSTRSTWIPQLEALISARELLSPYDKATADVIAAFEAGNYARAAALQTELAAAIEKAETEKYGEAGPLTARQEGLISWYRLFTRDFAESLRAAERAIALAPGELWIATNKAHALMFLGRPEEARAVYLGNKGRIIPGYGMWEEVIQKDFDDLEKRGLKHPQIAEIRPLLGPAVAEQ